MERSITVTGRASMTLKADLCTLDMTIEEKNKIYEKAAEKAAARMQALKKACDEAGLGDGLKTTRYNVRTDYVGVNENGIYKNIFDGYVCSYGASLSFDFTKEKLAELMERISDSGAETQLNISFSVKDRCAAEKALLEAVCDDAREKVNTICRRLEAYPGKILRVQQGGGIVNLRSHTEFDCAEEAAPMLMKSARFAPETAPADVTVNSEAVFEWEIL